MLKKNVQLLPPLKNISIWRRASLGMWRNACEAAIYSRLEIDATSILKKKAELKQNGYVISVATFVGKAIAQSLVKYPLINSIIRFNRIYPRQETNICFQVATGKTAEDLSTLCIKNCDQLSLTDISEQLRQGHSIFVIGKKCILPDVPYVTNYYLVPCPTVYEYNWLYFIYIKY